MAVLSPIKKAAQEEVLERFFGMITEERQLQVEACLFEDAGAIPNHPTLPMLVYKAALPKNAELIEGWFMCHGWSGAWRDGVYRFVHYHSTAHEVLGVYRGWARVRFGGTTGKVFDLQAGDAVVIPAGVGHQCLEASEDFQVVGAYPPEQSPDLLLGVAGERPQADRNIAEVPLPASDPVLGPQGPLIEHWLVVASPGVMG
jgi:uncharacterized protein YjlB